MINPHAHTAELVLMEHPYREALRKKYINPLRVHLSILLFFFFTVPFIIVVQKGFDMFIIVILIIFFFVFSSFFFAVIRHKLHYYKDYKFGFVIKERFVITRTMQTPSGICIYWLSSNDIKSFTPDPYRIFNTGDEVTIYYLKHSKEYLAYEL